MLFWMVYSFSQPMHSVKGAAYLFLSQSCTLWTLNKKVSIDFGPLKDKCEKYRWPDGLIGRKSPHMPWCYFTFIDSYLSCLNFLTSTDFRQHFSFPFLPLMKLHSPYWGNFCTHAVPGILTLNSLGALGPRKGIVCLRHFYSHCHLQTIGPK